MKTAQQAYEQHLKDSVKLLEEILKGLKSMPATPSNKWATVGSLADTQDKLQDILDQMNGTGEYSE